METQVKVLTTLQSALGAFCLCVGIPRFLNKSQHFTVHLFRPWRPGSARGSDGGPRRFTEVVPTPHAHSGQWPVASEDEASACSELRLGCHPETPVIEPCFGRDGLGARREGCPVACESDETKPAVMEKRQNKANFALALVYEWFAVRTHNGDIELGKQSRFGRLVVGGS